MIAKDLMTRDPVSISPEASVPKAAEIMLRHRISGLPVVDAAGCLIGMITEGDLMRRAEIATELHRGGFSEFQAGEERVAAGFIRAHGKRVGQVMTKMPFTVTPDAPIRAIVDIMDRRHVKRVPVVEGKRLVGIVSRADLLRALAKATGSPPPEKCEDSEIRQRLLSIYSRESWAPLASLDVFVRAGNVELVGTVHSEAQRAALITAAESVPGVRSVIDRLTQAMTSPA